MKKIIIPLFIALAFIQWWVPAQMIMGYEKVLKKGVAYKFLTEPVDPADPFRGKYISLNFKADEFLLPGNHRFTGRQEVYVGLAKDDSGYAKINWLSDKEPAAGSDYVKAIISYIDYDNKQKVHIAYPFDKYYMEEYRAPRAETVYRESNRDIKNRTYARIKIFNGDAVIEDVLINDSSIHKYLTR
jgi:uncharacterized membrane-anchored protein